MDICLQYKSLNKKAKFRLVQLQPGTCKLGNSNFLSLCACLRMTTKVLLVLFWGLQKTLASKTIHKYRTYKKLRSTIYRHLSEG